jgi:hypothetical protein
LLVLLCTTICWTEATYIGASGSSSNDQADYDVLDWVSANASQEMIVVRDWISAEVSLM